MLEGKNVDSVIYIHNKKAFTQSSAALHIVKQLSGLWPALYAFIIIPPFIRNRIYMIIARNRYRWFGKKETCMVPGPELKSRFLG
jgi:predicted DCC family thiol-disulfide oxidoreductase YuxK